MKRFILLCMTIAIFASCEQPTETKTEYVEVEVERTVTEYVDNVIVLQEIEYIEKETYIMSEVVIEPIETYDNYLSTDSKVYGIKDGEFIQIEGITGLIIQDDTIYYNRDGVGYKQVDDTIEESEIPTVESHHIVFDNSPFKIYTHMYNDMQTSRVSKYISEGREPIEAYLMIDSAIMFGNDLLFSVSETYGTREKGVYIWTVNGNPYRLFENGKIY